MNEDQSKPLDAIVIPTLFWGTLKYREDETAVIVYFNSTNDISNALRRNEIPRGEITIGIPNHIDLKTIKLTVERFFERGFEKGAPVILVSGCHIGDCHYLTANHWTEKRVQRVRKRMEKRGIRPERLQLEWISAAEGIRFASVMNKMEELRQSVTDREIADTVAILRNRKK